MHSLDLVVLAGGKGSRIKSLLNQKAKPMAIFNKIGHYKSDAHKNSLHILTRSTLFDVV